MKLSTLKAKTSRVWVEVDGNESEPPEKVWVDYRPGELTLEVADQMREAIATGFEADVAFALLKNLIIGWDLTEDDEVTPLEVNEANIKRLPISFLGAVMGEIQNEALPNEMRGVPSPASSSLEESTDTPPTGSFSSGQPND